MTPEPARPCRTEAGPGTSSGAESRRARPAGLRWGLARALLFGAGGILPFAFVHVDDVDGAVYQVIARHLAQDGRLLDLRFLPDFWPHFFEHPPLFLWIEAACIWLASERALPWLGAAIGMATVGVTYLAGRRLVGERAALLGAFLLASTEQFFRYQARPRLDPPLALAYTASVALLLAARGRTGWLLAGGLAAGLGALVKGPPAFGAPLSAALALVILGRWTDLRSPRAWIVTAVAMLLPAAALAAVDHVAFGGAWWNGYVRDQLLASLSGARVEGSTSHTYLVRSIAGGFWPGLPFLLVALAGAVFAPRAPRSRAVQALTAWAAVVVAGYSVAGRAYWWYAVPAFMPLALAAGAGLEAALHRGFAEAGPRWGVRVATVAGLLALALAPLWPEKWLVKPCSFGDLPALAARLGPTGTLLRLGPSPERSFTDVRAHAGWLAQHSGRDVTVTSELPASAGVFEVPAPGAPAGWSVVARHGAWVLAAPRAQGIGARER
jgi:4-amino-4-deoxy-L-arabinose transferase-like glycosyltransferase